MTLLYGRVIKMKIILNTLILLYLKISLIKILLIIQGAVLSALLLGYQAQVYIN